MNFITLSVICQSLYRARHDGEARKPENHLILERNRHPDDSPVFFDLRQRFRWGLWNSRQSRGSAPETGRCQERTPRTPVKPGARLTRLDS